MGPADRQPGPHPSTRLRERPPGLQHVHASASPSATRGQGRGGIHAVEVWNEPNIPEFWSGGINPERYVALLKRAFVAVNAVNSATTVVTAGLAPA